jgi:pectate lyase
MATGIEGPQVTVNYTCTPQTWDAAAVGWATQSGGITGGGTAAPTTVTTLAAFNTAAAGTAARVIMVSGRFSGTATIGSNKTILGMCGAEIDGHIQMGASSNVIVRNLKVVGLNCTDNADCQSGADAISVEDGADHLWFDHMDVSNGSDGNLDITQASDFVTVSWSKFSYTGRAGGHQFSNLVGADDGDTGDTGHLRVTWHHNWWSTGVQDRMPRVRFGQVHVVNGLYTSTGNDSCVGVGVNANILLENNIFIGVQDAIENTHANAASIIVSRGNSFQNVSGGFLGMGTGVFTPPYTYRVDTINGLQALLMAKTGVK